jgi:tRNA A37 threonylcarbamoyladenosine synthetase subunit TsaC/SUA5/YrdC
MNQPTPEYKGFETRSKFGLPSEIIAQSLWTDHRKIAFASSANPSGGGNSGRVEGIGDRIASEADLIIDADDYVGRFSRERTSIPVMSRA